MTWEYPTKSVDDDLKRPTSPISMIKSKNEIISARDATVLPKYYLHYSHEKYQDGPGGDRPPAKIFYVKGINMHDPQLMGLTTRLQ